MYFQKNFSQNCDLKLTQFVLLMFIDLATKCSLTKVEYMNKSWNYAPPHCSNKYLHQPDDNLTSY